MEIDQYAIVLVKLGRTVGSEMRKTRPCLVISPDEMNEALSTLVIAPLTSRFRAFPTRVTVTHNKKKGQIALDQIRTVDRERVLKTFPRIDSKVIDRVKAVLYDAYVA